MHREPVTVEAPDGRPIAAVRHPAPAPRAVAVIRGGTAIRQRFYARFAAWLAAHGITTWTFDYRGIGDSRRPGPLRREPATYLDWALRDAPAVTARAAAEHPALPLIAIGHSFGAQALGLDPAPDRYAAALLIAAGTGQPRHWPIPHRFGLWTLWRVMPLIAMTLGHVPGRLGLGEDLPAGAARDWARWCRHPAFLRGVLGPEVARHGEWRAPLTMMSFADDAYAPPGSAAELFEWYARAPGALHDRDAGPAGHFGFFRGDAADALWPRALRHIERMLAAPVSGR
ncbi:MAG: alpha/beta hydrolase [Myxococcales bacterium]|nr:alpha/beta hydrolase [Myxococcales bacterium]